MVSADSGLPSVPSGYDCRLKSIGGGGGGAERWSLVIEPFAWYSGAI